MYDLEISLLGANLGVGQSVSGLCPVCGGGHSREKSLSVTRLQTALAWHCHRASCGAGGYVGGTSKLTEATMEDAVAKLFGAFQCNLNLENLPQEQEVSINARFQIPKETLDYFGVRWHSDSHSIAFPVYNDSVYLSPVGYQLRDENKKITVARFTRDFVSGGFFSRRGDGRKSDLLIFVEDPFSALKVSQIADSFCLYGTHLNYEKVCSAVNENYPRALLHLDWDARAKSLKYQREYGMFFESLLPVFSLQDPKNLSLEHLRNLYGITADRSGHEEPQSMGTSQPLAGTTRPGADGSAGVEHNQ